MLKFGLLLARFRRELMLAWTLLRDPRTPAAAKLAILAAAVYVVSPIDLVTDFLPLLGWIDDGIVALLLFQLAQRLLPQELLVALKEKSNRAGPG